MRLELLLVILISVYAVILSITTSWVWVAVMASSALTLGAISALVGARKLFFLAGAAPHSGLLAVLVAIPLAYMTGYDPVVIASLVGVLLVYMVGYAIHRGHDPDVSTSVFIAFSASLSVILAYYVLTNYPVQTDISAIILGDPLLATPTEALFMMGLSAVSFVIVWTTYREQVSIGIDRDSARLAGIKVWVYDLIVFTLLGLAAAALLRIIGFILEHVLILIPVSIALTASKSSGKAFTISILSALTAGLLGLNIALVLNLPPSGVTGVILLAYYLLSLLGRGRK